MIFALAASGTCLLVLNAYALVRPEHGIARTLFLSKSTVVFGALYLLLALGLLVGRGRIAGRLDRAFEALPTAHGFWVGLVLAAVLWVPANLQPVLVWALHNAAQFEDEVHYSRLGLLLKATTTETTRIAVVAAGATPYFSERPAEDMLGKNDAYIARLAPVGVFSPGHDKWDYHYTLGERQPEIMVELLDATPADERYIASLGYVTLPNGLYVKTAASGVDRSLLGRAYDTQAALDLDLAQARARGAMRAPFGVASPDVGAE